MTGRIASRLDQLGITLPEASRAAANYRATVLHGGILHVAGQLPLVDNKPVFIGSVPDEVGVDTAYRAARLCAINILAHVAGALGGDLNRVQNVIRVAGFIRSSSDFTAHAKVMDGASDLFVEIFGDSGCPIRVSVGVISLPRGAPVEIEASFAVS